MTVCWGDSWEARNDLQSHNLAMAPRNTLSEAAPVVRDIGFVGRKFLDTQRETSSGPERHFSTKEEAPCGMLADPRGLGDVEARYQLYR